jgi:hypothetical protein
LDSWETGPRSSRSWRSQDAKREKLGVVAPLIILATQEAGIGEIMAEGHSRENFHEAPSQSIRGMVVLFCNPSYTGDGDQEDHGLRPAGPRKFIRTPFKPIKAG